MGYTHYHTQNRSLTAAEWDELITAFNHMLSYLPAYSHSAGGYFTDCPLMIRGGDGRGQPIANGRYLCFNGDAIGDDDLAHETFYLERQGSGFYFCKTARKPYAFLVCALLLVVSEIAPGAFDVSSDGNMRGEEWQPAREFLRGLPTLFQQT